MRILHTSDWHLGRMLYGRSLLEDQEHFIYHVFLPFLDEEKPDAICLSGDIFDRQVAPVEAMRLFDETVQEVCLNRKIPMLAVTGNHDSADRISIGLKLLKKGGLHIGNRIFMTSEPVVLTDRYGPVYFHMAPHFEPSVIRYAAGMDRMTAQEASAYLFDLWSAGMNQKERNVLVGHCFVNGSSFGESENAFAVGGSLGVNADVFSAFDYTALGHLHRMQPASASVWYSGSPLKFSFDEEKHVKGFLLVTLGEKGTLPEIRQIPINPKRDMRKIKGSLEELMKAAQTQPGQNDYLYAELLGETPEFEPMRRLREWYPNILALQNQWMKMGDKNDDRESLKQILRQRKNADEDIFSSFMRLMCGRDPEKSEMKIYRTIMAQVETAPWEYEQNLQMKKERVTLT